MPIKGLTETFKLPRLGKIRLGIRVPNKSGLGDHPQKVDYFVVPPEYAETFKRVYGTDKPNKLDILFPIEDEEIWASQFYRAYSQTRGLVCRGDGETAEQSVDAKSGELAWKGIDIKVERRQVPCRGRDCPHYQAKRCHERMFLQFMLPRIPGLGVWQIDTGSINSIINVNSDVRTVRAVLKRISMVPLTLSLEPQDVNNPETGKKEKAYTLHLRAGGTLNEFVLAARANLAALEMPKAVPDDEGFPDADLPEHDADGVVVESSAARVAWDGLKSANPQPAENAPVVAEAPNPPPPAPPVPPAQPQAAEPAIPAQDEKPYTGECPAPIRRKIAYLCGKVGREFDDEKAKKLTPSQVDAQIRKLEAEISGVK